MKLALPAHHRLLVAVALVFSALSLSNCGGGGDGASGASMNTAAGAQDDSASGLEADVTAGTSEQHGAAQGSTSAPDAMGSSDGAALDKNRNDHWGAAPSSALARNPEAWLPAMAQAGITTVRNFEAGPGDDKLTPILAAGMSVVGILQWSSSTPYALPANDLAGWRSYVTDQVTRYKGRVRYWEIWNEPPNFTADQSPVSYAKVVATAYDAAKAVDPAVQLGLAAKSNHVNWLAESIAAGAADKFDFVTLHPYEVAGLLPQGWEGQFMSIVPRVRRMLQALNPAKARVPVWFTEIGMSAAPPGSGGFGPHGQADGLVKIYTMAFAQGVERIYWFDPSDSEGLTMGLTTADGAKRPAWQALRSLRTQLGARPAYVGWTQPANAWYGFVFNGPQGVVLSAWTRAGQTAALALASDVTAIDPRTGASTTTRSPTLTEAPILLVAPAGSAQATQWLAAAAANNGKPFPWNGDHSASASVRLRAGALPDGVFMVNAPPATAAVDNTAELSLAGTIGACFAVDPTFLSYAYAATPIRITAEVRGQGIGDPGFELLYESGRPIASTDVNNLAGSSSGWFRIRGTTFQEKTWTLPDARFIGLYGYNFCFYAIGPEHSSFSIRQVTVRR